MSRKTEEEEPKCQHCNLTRAEHEGKRHPFQAYGEEPDTSWVKPKVKPHEQLPDGVQPGVAMPFDPVLRQALIDRGLLSIEDLEAAERKIRAVTNTLMGGEVSNEPATDDGGSGSHGVWRSTGDNPA